MRDLTRELPNAIAAERSRVATEGWGAQLLAKQSPAGDWGGGPKWDLITLFSLVVLKDLGLEPAGKQARKMLVRIQAVLRLTERDIFRDAHLQVAQWGVMVEASRYKATGFAVQSPPLFRRLPHE